jgi:uncharacterized protein DUF3108
MNRNNIILFIIFVVFVSQGCASTGVIKTLPTENRPIEINEKQKNVLTREEAEEVLTKRPNIILGEKLTYMIAWNGIPVGFITAKVTGPFDYQGNDVYQVVLKTESNKYLSRIYKVEDTYISYVGVKDLASKRYEADRKEGNYKKHVVVEYDMDKMKAEYTSLTDGSVKYADIKEPVHDLVSAMYYFLSVPVKLHDKVNITVNLNEKNYELYGEVEQFDVVKLPSLGSHTAFRVRPYALLKGKHYKKGSGYLYFSTAEKRYPLYGVVWIPFGKVTATLKTIEKI